MEINKETPKETETKETEETKEPEQEIKEEQETKETEEQKQEEQEQEQEKEEQEEEQEEEEQEEEQEEEEQEEQEEQEETETEEEQEPELSWFERIKRDFKTKGNFPKIDPLGFLPPFPAVAVLQVLSSANKLFQDNLPKVGEYATLTIDTEIAKKKHNLELIDALAEQTKHTNVENKVDHYIDHVLDS